MPSASRFAPVCAFDDLADGEMLQVTVDGVEVLLSRVEGAYYATTAHCTHYGAPLVTGLLTGRTVVCPWHHAVFDVTDGSLVEPPAPDALKQFATRVEDGRVLVRVQGADGEQQGEGIAYRESDGRTPPMVSPEAESDDRLFVIVGGGAAGEAAAEALRSRGYQGRIVLVTRESHAPYDRTKLSKAFLAGKADAESLPLRADGFYERFGIEVERDRTVERLDSESSTLVFRDGGTLEYDGALVCTGGSARALPVPGGELDGVFRLRSWADAEQIVDAAEGASRVAIVGSSFIGMEAAASLRARDIAVTVVSQDAVPFENVLGPEVGAFFQRKHEAHGVTFHLGTGVERIEEAGDGLALWTEGGDRVETDLVLVGIGVTPNTDFVHDVERADDGGLVADATLQLAPGLFAAGDIVHYPDPRLGQRVRIEHWRLAQQHGRIAARNLLGEAVPFTAVPFFWSGQYDASLRYVGHAEEWDRVVVDGDLEEGPFLAYYVQDGTVRAAAGVGRDVDVAALHAILAFSDGVPEADLDGFSPQNALDATQSLV